MGSLRAVLCLLLLCPGLAAAAPSCPQNVKISGGNFTLSRGWAPGSVLVYSCPLGRYPVPTSRLCLSSGRWQTPRSSPVAKAVCKPVRCPAPVAFENGMYTPRLGSHPVGGNLSFECEDGFVLRGSPVRQCRPNGMWDGETAVCDNGAGHCPNPGIPVGSVRTGSRFGLGDKVNYRCSSNLVLTGSAERECQDSGVWSGTEPICRQPYSYDFPEDVAPALGTSLSHLLGSTNPTQKKSENVGRKIQIQRSGHLNLYLLLDASQSVKEEDFSIFKESATLMVDRVRARRHAEIPLLRPPPSPPPSRRLPHSTRSRGSMYRVMFSVPQTPTMCPALWWVLGAVLGDTNGEQHGSPFPGIRLLEQGSAQRGAQITHWVRQKSPGIPAEQLNLNH